jgi:tetratricopeptide (TPR) repeat protein
LRSFHLLLVVTVSSVSIAQSRSAPSPSAIYSENQGSVVTIYTFDAQKAPLAQGSGFVVGKNRVVTNYHVLAGSTSATVAFTDGSTAVIQSVVAASNPKDIAIVDVLTGNRPALHLGNELDVKVGETVYAIGAPKGLTASLSSGLVSAFREDEGEFLIQITAPIAAGSSGGPLFNGQGRVIGITTSRLKDSGFGFAVGASDIARLARAPLPMAIALSDLVDHDAGANSDELKPARDLLEAKKYTDALGAFEAAPAKLQAGYDGQYLLCRIQTNLRNSAAAISACDEAIKTKPESAEAYAMKAMAHYSANDFERAEAAALQAKRLSGDSSYGGILGLIYYSEEKYVLVAQQLSADSKDAFDLTLLEGAAIRTGDRDNAVSLAKKIYSLKGSENGWRYYFEGVNAQRELNFSAAIEKYRKCDADDDFMDPICIVSVARAELQSGDRDKSKQDIDGAVLRYGRNRSVLSEAMFIDIVTGNSAEARRLHDVWLGAPHGDQDDFSECLYYYATNQSSLATEHCSAAREKSPHQYVSWSNSGWVALDNGQYRTAAQYFAKASELYYASKDKHTVAQELDVNMGVIVATYLAGDVKDARSLFKALAKAYPDFTTMSALKQLPLVWSDRSQDLASEVIVKVR